MLTRLTTAIAIVGLIYYSAILFVKSDRVSIDIPKSDCVETCIKALQNKSIFPEFNKIAIECDRMFGSVESCQLTAPKGEQ